MTKKTLMVLVAVLAGLVGVLKWAGRFSGPASEGQEISATPLLAGVDMATLHAVEMADGSNTTRLERAEGGWVVVQKDGYPADIDRLRRLIQALDEMGEGELMDRDGARLADYGLERGGESVPLSIALEHGRGKTVLSLGALRESRRPHDMWGPPPGRYARVDQGPVRLLKDGIALAEADSDRWWNPVLLALPPEAIHKITVERDGETFAVRRNDDGAYDPVDAEDSAEVDAPSANRLFGALRNLRADRLVAADEEEVQSRFKAPVRYEAETSNATYAVVVGAPASEGGGERPVRIQVDGDSKFDGRTYIVSSYLADAMTLTKSEVIRGPKPEPAVPPVPEPAAAGSEEPSAVAATESDVGGK